MIHCCFYFGSYTIVIQSLWFLHCSHPVTLVFTPLSYCHFGYYTVVIQSLRFLHRCHSPRLLYHGYYFGSYTVISSSYTIVPSSSYTIGFDFTVLTPFVISFYSSYTVCRFILRFLDRLSFHLRFFYRCYLFLFLYHCHYSWVLPQFSCQFSNDSYTNDN